MDLEESRPTHVRLPRTPIVVDLEGNSRLIEELEVGDFVLARSEFDPTGPLELKRIEEKFVRTAAVMELVVLGRSIKTTAEHPFYVPLQGKFIAAGELKAGDELVGHSGQIGVRGLGTQPILFGTGFELAVL